MTFQDLYLGQRVRILSWDELNSISYHDSAYGIYLPDNSFFNNEMKYLCGATLTIVNEPSYFDRDKRYLSSDIFQFDDPILSLSFMAPPLQLDSAAGSSHPPCSPLLTNPLPSFLPPSLLTNSLPEVNSLNEIS